MFVVNINVIMLELRSLFSSLQNKCLSLKQGKIHQFKRPYVLDMVQHHTFLNKMIRLAAIVRSSHMLCLYVL